MGLDGVELLMKVEGSFGIQILAERSSEINTVGDLYAIVLKKTRDVTRSENTCLTRATFYELRPQFTSPNVAAPIHSSANRNLRVDPAATTTFAVKTVAERHGT
jgi:hypothetical protein